MVVLILVVVWIVALTPFALRKLGEWQLNAGVDRFRHTLGVLRQFAPGSEEDEYLGEPFGAQVADEARDEGGVGEEDGVPRPSSELVMRRRRVLTWLGCSLAGSFVLGAIPWFRPLWGFSLVVLALGVVYLAALVYVQRRAALVAERAAKVVRLRALRAGEERRVSPTPEPMLRAAATGGMPAPAPAQPLRGQIVALPRRPAFTLVEAPR